MWKAVKITGKVLVALGVLFVTFFAGMATVDEFGDRNKRAQIYAPEASRSFQIAQRLREGQVKEAQVSADYVAARWLFWTAYDVPNGKMAKLRPEVLAAWQEAKEYYQRYDVNDAPYDTFATVSRVKDKLTYVPWSPMQTAKREFKAKYGGGKLEKAPVFEIEHWFAQPVSASDMAGKVILLDFWNVGCKPCEKSLPKVQSIYEKYGPKGLVVIGLAGGPTKVTAEFLKKHACTFPAGRETDKTWLNFAIEGVPSYFMIDKQGRLAWGPQHELPDANEIERLLDAAEAPKK